jgi:hypothetical protein
VEERQEQPDSAQAKPAPSAPDDGPETGQDEYPFLVPGPTPETNEGCLRWGLTWTLFSLVLIVIVLVMSVGCWFLARGVGIT